MNFLFWNNPFTEKLQREVERSGYLSPSVTSGAPLVLFQSFCYLKEQGQWLPLCSLTAAQPGKGSRAQVQEIRGRWYERQEKMHTTGRM